MAIPALGLPALVVPPSALADATVAVSSTADSHDPGTLRSAIDAANTDGMATVVEVSPGTYTLDLCGSDDDNTGGDLDHTAADPITIQGTGPGVVIEQTCPGERVLHGLGGGTFALIGVTVTGGDVRGTDSSEAFDPAGDALGGGILTAGPLTISGSTLTGNSVRGGDGLWMPGGAASGGGVASGGALTITNTTVSGNTATGGTGGDWSLFVPIAVPEGGPARGGGLFTAGTLGITGSTIADNTAAGGTGGTETDVWGTPATGGVAEGGGIFADAVDLDSTTVDGNEARGGAGFGSASGGGIFVAGSSLTQVTGATVSGNTATAHAPGADEPAIGCPTEGAEGTAHGGGIWLGAGDLDLDGTTIAGNRAAVVPGTWTVPAAELCVVHHPPLEAVGGGLFTNGYVSMGASTVSGNEAHGGDGADLSATGPAAPHQPGGRAAGGGIAGPLTGPSEDVQIGGSVVADNTAAGGDGGFAGDGSRSPGGDALGGGVYNGGGIAVLRSTLTGNQAAGGVGGTAGSGRGGHLASSGLVDLSFSTVDGGGASDGGVPGSGGVSWTSGAGLTGFLASTIGPTAAATAVGGLMVTERSVVLAPPAGTVCDSAAAGSDGYSYVADTSCGLAVWGAPGDVEGGPDPLLLPVGDWGGPTPTRPPAPSSPLVDAIPLVDCGGFPDDQRGVTRPQGPGCDIGSVELEVDPLGGAVFEGLDPLRLLDSRLPGVGDWDGSPLGAGVRGLPVAGSGGIPDDAVAVVASVTVTQPTMPSYVALRPEGAVAPPTANLVFGPGQTTTNLVTVGVSPTTGGVEVLNQQGSVHVVVDVVGFYRRRVHGAGFAGLDPVRALDSRVAEAAPWDGSPLGAGATRALSVAGQFGVPGSATGVVANVTVTGGTAGSFLAVSPEGASAGTANLLFAAGETRSALVVVPLSSPSIEITNQLGSVHVVVDVVGYFDLAVPDRFHAVDPDRLLDSRTALGFAGPLPGGETRLVDVTGTGSLPDGATTVVGNLTATQGSANTYLSLAPYPSAAPGSTANLVVPAGATEANATYVGIGDFHCVEVFNQVGDVHAVLDAAGYFAPDPT